MVLLTRLDLDDDDVFEARLDPEEDVFDARLDPEEDVFDARLDVEDEVVDAGDDGRDGFGDLLEDRDSGEGVAERIGLVGRVTLDVRRRTWGAGVGPSSPEWVYSFSVPEGSSWYSASSSSWSESSSTDHVSLSSASKSATP